MNLKNMNIINSFILILCIVMVIVFSFIAFNLQALARWANYQSICIEQESIESTVPWAVRKCNGRSKVYQVK